MKEKILLKRLEELIQKGEKVRATVSQRP